MLFILKQNISKLHIITNFSDKGQYLSKQDINNFVKLIHYVITNQLVDLDSVF